MPRSRHLFAALFALLVLVVVAPGAAAAGCGGKVIEDWQDNGTIDVTFEARCYAEALRLEPADARQYSDFRAAVQRAIVRDRRIKADEAEQRRAAAARASRSGSTDGGRYEAAPADEAPPEAPQVEPTPPSAVDEPVDVLVAEEIAPVDDGPEPALATEPEPDTASDEALPTLAAAPSDPLGTGGVPVDRGAALPGPVRAVAVLAALLGALGCAGLVAQRRRRWQH